METCEQGAIVRDTMGATGWIYSKMAAMYLVTFLDGTANLKPGGSNIHPLASLIRQASLNLVEENGVIVGKYLFTNPADMFQFCFDLAENGSYTLQESAGTYETSDRNSINLVDGELDSALGWMSQETIGSSVEKSDHELRCVVQQRRLILPGAKLAIANTARTMQSMTIGFDHRYSGAFCIGGE